MVVMLPELLKPTVYLKKNDNLQDDSFHTIMVYIFPYTPHFTMKNAQYSGSVDRILLYCKKCRFFS